MVLARQLLIDANAPNVPLPLPIDDADLGDLVLTHHSFNGASTTSLEYPAEIATDNQSLAIRGDAILRDMLAETVQQKHPRLTPGGQTRLLSALLSTETLARIATRFNYHKRIRAASDQFENVQKDIVAQATVFQAYIGALIADGTSREEVYTFIAAIFGTILYNEYTWLANGNFEKPVKRSVEADTGPPPTAPLPTPAPTPPRPAAPVVSGPAAPGPSNSSARSSGSNVSIDVGQNWIGQLKEYNETGGRQPLKIEYHIIRPFALPNSRLSVYIDGKLAGTGHGTTKPVASRGAAAEAYRNRARIWGR